MLDTTTNRLELDLHPITAGRIDVLARIHHTTPDAVIAMAIMIADRIEWGEMVCTGETFENLVRGKSIRWTDFNEVW